METRNARLLLDGAQGKKKVKTIKRMVFDNNAMTLGVQRVSIADEWFQSSMGFRGDNAEGGGAGWRRAEVK